MRLLGRLTKRGAQTAINLAQNVVVEAIADKNVGASIKQYGLKAAKRVWTQALSSALGQFSAASRKPAPARKRATPSRKRAAPSKAKQRAKHVKNNF